MISPDIPRTGLARWAKRGLFVLICCAILLVQLTPFDLPVQFRVWPDALLLVSCVWVVRRPDYVPVCGLAVLFLLADFLLQRPPGLWAGLALIMAELLRARAADLRDVVFGLEWAFVAVFLSGFYALYALASFLVVPYAMPMGLLALQWVLTCATYPLVAFICAALFGLTKRAGMPDVAGRAA